jgi:hypothetical protein
MPGGVAALIPDTEHQAVAAGSQGQPGQVVVRMVGADERKDPFNGKVPARLVQVGRVSVRREIQEFPHPGTLKMQYLTGSSL